MLAARLLVDATVTLAAAILQNGRVQAETVTLPKEETRVQIPWNMNDLVKPPQVFPAPGLEEEGVRAIFYEGLPWQGKPTRVFAYLGIPERAEGERVPGIVLVHGGGGTAMLRWVRLWVSRGYVAISMDTCGATPGEEHNKHPRHEWGGPPGWGGFDKVEEPVTDQWSYHAIADVILANSLLRSLPEVDADRIGLTGISWGGYLTCIAAGVDDRFRFAAPVYGCGFLGEESAWVPTLQEMGAERAAKWLALWDPSQYLPYAKMAMLWVTGTNDSAYPLGPLQKSYRLPSGPRTLCIRVRMPHAHEPGETPEEIYAFAESILRGTAPLASVTSQGEEGNRAWVTFQAAAPIVRAEFNYTCDQGPWKDREWRSIPATLNATSSRASSPIPDKAAAYYFNLVDSRDLIVSSEHVTREPQVGVGL